MKENTHKRLLENVINLANVVEAICSWIPEDDLPRQVRDELDNTLGELNEMMDSHRAKVIIFYGPNGRSPTVYCDTKEEAKELAYKYARELSGWKQIDRVQVWLPGGIEPYYQVKGGWEEERRRKLEADMEDYGPEVGKDY